jgi:hypothetical protein
MFFSALLEQDKIDKEEVKAKKEEDDAEEEELVNVDEEKRK